MPDNKNKDISIDVLDPSAAEGIVRQQDILRTASIPTIFGLAGGGTGVATALNRNQEIPNVVAEAKRRAKAARWLGNLEEAAQFEEVAKKVQRSPASYAKRGLAGAGIMAGLGLGATLLTRGDPKKKADIMRQAAEKRVKRVEQAGYIPNLVSSPHDVDYNSLRTLASRETKRRNELLRAEREGRLKMAQDEGYLDGFEETDPITEDALNKKLAQVRNHYVFKKMSEAIKLSEQEKQAIIDKAVKSNFDQDLDELSDKEPCLPEEVQDLMSDKISDALSTAGGMLIVIKPKEFQRMYVRAIGKPDLADELDSHGMCFRPGGPPDPHFGLSGSIIPEILKALLPVLLTRSAVRPALNRRITMIKVVKTPEDSVKELDHPLMDKISSAYTSYRRDLIYTLPQLVKSAVAHQDFRNFLFSSPSPYLKEFAKLGSDVVQSMVTTLPVSYINRAHLSEPVSQFVDENCSFDGLTKAGELARLSGIA